MKPGRAIIGSLLIVVAAFAQPKTLTILHTNDMHAAFIPHEAVWVRSNPKPMVGGFTELCFTLDSLRRGSPATLLLDAGDVMTGNPVTERVYGGAYGGVLFAMMDLMRYDAWCPGNHDFDVSQENLRALTRIATFPTLCANVVDDQGRYPVGNVPATVIERGGLRIGIVGIMSQGLYGLVNQNNLTGIRVLSPVETAQREINALRGRVDLVVCLTHQGVEDDSALAASVTGLDVIVGGHSHTRLRQPLVVNGVIIVQTGSNCENLGKLDLVVENRHVASFHGMLLPLWARADRQRTAVTALVDSMQHEIEKEYSEVIGTLEGDWLRSQSPSTIGSFVTEAQRTAAHADVAFMNDHGIRKDMLKGPITKRDLFEILPFRNILTTFQLSGKDLLGILRYDLEKKPAIQIAGIACRWSMGTDGAVVLRDVRVQGTPIDEGRMYICAASDFFAGEAKHYLGMGLPPVIYLRQTVFEAVEKAIRAEGHIVPSATTTFLQEP